MRIVIVETKLEQKAEKMMDYGVPKKLYGFEMQRMTVEGLDESNGFVLGGNCQNTNPKLTTSLPTMPIFNFRHHAPPPLHQTSFPPAQSSIHNLFLTPCKAPKSIPSLH